MKEKQRENVEGITVVAVEMPAQMPRDVAPFEHLHQGSAIAHAQGKVADGDSLLAAACHGKGKQRRVLLHLPFNVSEEGRRGEAVETHPIGHAWVLRE